MKVYVLAEDPREDGEVLLVTADKAVAVRGAIEILRQNFMPKDPDDDEEGHIWHDYEAFDKELSELGEAAFWRKYDSAWAYCVCSIYEMQLTG